jgi:hypothetical protein
VSMRSMASSASAFLISTPARAPRPVPTITAIGVASPRAQGQAMISTATAETKARGRAGAGAKIIQPRKVSSEMLITAGTKTAETRSARC